MTATRSLSLMVTFAWMTLVLARLTLLVNEDLILERPREWIITWSIRHQHPKVGKFIVCPWCVGFWIAVAGTQLVTHLGYVSLPLPAMWPWALNMVASAMLLILDHA